MSTTYPDELVPYVEDFDLRNTQNYPYMHAAQAETFPTLSALRAALKDAGSHYFDRDSVKFFRARTHGDVSGQRFFVESFQYGDDAPRQYRVSWVSRHGVNLGVEHSRTVSTLEEARAVRALFVKHYGA